MSGTILRRHEREVQQIVPRELRADEQTRGRALFRVSIIQGDLDYLIERLVRLADDYRRHELRNRGDGTDALCILRVQDGCVCLIENDDRARPHIGLTRECPESMRGFALHLVGD